MGKKVSIGKKELEINIDKLIKECFDRVNKNEKD